MQRVIPPLVLMLVLCGCSARATTVTAPTAASTTEATGVSTTSLPVPSPTTTLPETTTEPDDGTPGVSCEEPVRVGVITDQTGALAIYGTHITRSFPLGMEYATGAPADGDVYAVDDCRIEVVFKDDGSDTERAVTLASELIEVDDVDIIVGSVSHGATAELQDLAIEKNVIHIAAPASSNDLTGATFNPNSFRTSRTTNQEAASLCEYLSAEADTFVQLAPDYAAGHDAARAFRDACTSFGGEFVADDILAPTDTLDFTPHMEAVLDSGADVLITTWAGGGLLPMIQTASSLGVVDQMSIGTMFSDNRLMPVFFADLVGTASGIVYHYTLPDNEVNDWLVARTLDTAGTYPDLFDADGMNAALLIVEALKATGGDATADALRNAMEGLAFQGPKGEIEIRAEDHVAIQDMYIATLTDLDDPQSGFFELTAVNRPVVPCLLEGEYASRCGELPMGEFGA